MFLKASSMESAIFFEMKEECKVFWVELIVWSIVAQEGTNILFFHIFNYGAECSAGSGAKKNFIFCCSSTLNNLYYFENAHEI